MDRTSVSSLKIHFTSPDDVIVVSQVELLGVFSGVVDHTHSSHEVNHLLPGGVVQVVTALVSSVTVDPFQPQLAARRRLVRHGGFRQRLKVKDPPGSKCSRLLGSNQVV